MTKRTKKYKVRPETKKLTAKVYVRIEPANDKFSARYGNTTYGSRSEYINKLITKDRKEKMYDKARRSNA